MDTTRKRTTATSLFVLTVLAAGCIGGLPAGSSVDAAVVEEQVEQRYAALDGYAASITRTVEVGGVTRESRATVAVERGDRRTVTYTAGPRAGETTVESAGAGPVFDAGLGAGGPTTPVEFGALAGSLVSANDVTVTRVTTHDSRRAAVLELTPSGGDGPANLTRTVWVDLDRRIPLRVVTSWTTTDGESATVTVEYDDVTLYERNGSAAAEVAA